MTTYTEDLHAGAFIASEGPGTRSRDSITVLSGQNLKAGAVLGKVAHGTASAAADAGNTGGSGTIGAVTLGNGAKAGKYVATCIEPGTNAGKFMVQDPDGVEIGVATVAVAFSAAGIGFTITDATDFVSGDRFVITVAAGSGKYVAYDDAGTDGREVAAAVLFDAVDASGGDKPGVAVVRDAEVASAKLVWDSGQDSTAKANGLADLAILGIIAR